MYKWIDEPRKTIILGYSVIFCVLVLFTKLNVCLGIRDSALRLFTVIILYFISVLSPITGIWKAWVATRNDTCL